MSAQFGDTHAPGDEHPAEPHVPAPGESSIPELEIDENIAPRPEEEIADRLRAEPDVEDHARHRDDRGEEPRRMRE